MTDQNKQLLQIVVIAFLLILAIWYALTSGRAEALVLALGLLIWTLACALLRKIGLEI